MGKDFDAVVIGAGVSGLSTAICLQEEGLRVLIRSQLAPQESTSMLASAMIGPNFAPPGDRTSRWYAETERRLTPGVPGVSVIEGRMAARPPGAYPPGAQQLTGFRESLASEKPAGYGTVFWIKQTVVDMPPYLRHLTARFIDAGGELVLEPVSSLADAAAIAPRVANCAGLGAAALTGDKKLRPARGPKIIVENPGIDTFFLEAPFGPLWAGFIPHGDHVVLGGSFTESADTTPDRNEEAEIIRLCALVEPALASAKVLDHQVGLRPNRPEPRLEAEERDGARVVHNYGHAGVGVMLSWGCAKEAATLLKG